MAAHIDTKGLFIGIETTPGTLARPSRIPGYKEHECPTCGVTAYMERVDYSPPAVTFLIPVSQVKCMNGHTVTLRNIRELAPNQ